MTSSSDDPDGEGEQATLAAFTAAGDRDADGDRLDRIERDVDALKDVTERLTENVADVVDAVDGGPSEQRHDRPTRGYQ